MKLDEGNFIQWQQHVLLIAEGYDLFGFLDATVDPPSQFVANPEGQFVLNPKASMYH